MPSIVFPRIDINDIQNDQSVVDAFDKHEFIISLNDKKSGLRAYVAIHNTNLGIALGGTRMKPYDKDSEALQDVLNLSKAMSYKCAMSNLPYGGGKAVIIINDNNDRDQLLLSYACRIEKLRGLFRTGTDVGISDDDVKKMATKTQYMLGVSEADRGDLSTSKVAALGVFSSMRAVLRQLDGEANFKGKRIAIKGIGKLGAELAKLTHEAGATVLVADIDPQKTRAMQEKLKDVIVFDVDEIHKQAADIYAPCALGGDLTMVSVLELQCRAVVGGANNQLANVKVGDLLYQRNILYAPDYIANAGGLIYVADELEPDGFSKQRVIERTQAIEETMINIFTKAQQDHASPHRVADELAQARIDGRGDGK